MGKLTLKDYGFVILGVTLLYLWMCLGAML